MAVQNLKYCEYFDVNEKYFPCIDESAINSGASWDDTYPHTTFIDLLNLTEKMLGGNTNRSIWIHGAYGTGKSKCAYTLKKILEVSDDEVKAYWDKFEPLKKNNNASTTLLCCSRECKEGIGRTRGCIQRRKVSKRKRNCLAGRSNP